MGASGSKEGTAPDKVDVRDFHAVKATLDDYSVELLKKAGYSIDHRLDDMQMGIAIVAVRIRSVRRRLSARGVSGEHSDPLIPPVCQALDRSIAPRTPPCHAPLALTLALTLTPKPTPQVLLALTAQFWGRSEYWTFMPELRDKPIVLVPCVLGYFGLSGLLWCIESYSMKNAIAILTSSPGLPGLRLYSSTKFPDDHYTLKLTMGQKESVRKEYVGTLFDEDGEIQLKALSVMVNDLVHEMDEPSESSNGDSKKDQ